MIQRPEIIWPDYYDPRNSAVHVSNHLTINTQQELIWAWLIRAALWPDWYVNSSHVKFLAGEPPDLKLNTQFHWKTFGITIKSTVLEYVPNERIAWDAHGLGFTGYHAWVIQPLEEGGCYVRTEETQHGWLARLNNLFLPNRMFKYHQIWLESLATKACSGMPPEA